MDKTHLGKVLPAPLRVRVAPGKFREPDAALLLTANFHLRGEGYWSGADLVVEVVSPDDPNRDLKTKREEYAAAGIAEYWIVDPRDRTITVLTLPAGGTVYGVAGKYSSGQTAASALLTGFEVDVTETFNQT